ncbi:MAG: glycosyltransferase family 2 protein, partial [Chryseolinea sp.]
HRLQDSHLVVSDCVVVNEQLKTLMPSYFDFVNAKAGVVRNMVRTSSYIGCCMAFRREVLELALPFPPHIPMHDFWIAMLAEFRFRIDFVHEPLVLYRRHGSANSFTAGESTHPLAKRISFRINTLLPLFSRLLR